MAQYSNDRSRIMSEQPLTYEGILELFRKADRRIKKTERQMKENARLMKEQVAEYARKQEGYEREKKEHDAEYARKQEEYEREKKERDAEYERRMRKTELAMERMCQEVGGLGNSIGRIIEHMIGERIIEKFQALGYNVTHPVVRNCSFSSTKLGLYGEFDLTLVDSDIIILIEVKTTLETSHVRKHLKKIEEYRNHIAAEGFVQPHVRHLLPNTRFIGAVAGAVVEDEAKQFAFANGLYVIVQSGEAVEIVPTPEGFKAKEW